MYQTFPSSKRHGPLLVPRHVSRRQICQKYFPQCPLHRGLQEPAGTIGSTQRLASVVSHYLESQFGHLSSRHHTSVSVFGVGFAPGVVRPTTVVEPRFKRRGMDAYVSKASSRSDTECQVKGCLPHYFEFVGRYQVEDYQVEGYRDWLHPCFGFVGKKS